MSNTSDGGPSPNVVLVITDDQGMPPLGSSGHPYIQTPHLDAFHGESVRFTDFHSGTTCAPTRAGLFTGRYCNSTGVWHTIGGRSLLRRDEWTLADALRGAGYRTGLFGKWHLGDEYPYRPQDRGFETVVCHGGGGVSQQPDWWGNDYFNDTYLANGEPVAYEGYCTDVFFREGIRFIEEHAHDPFLCVISTNAPHGPWNVEPRYRDLYSDRTDSESYARFLGMCTNIDENFGALRAALQKLGLEDDTILIFMSDNGQTGVRGAEDDMYNAGMRGFKGSPYEGGHRIPFFVRWPGGKVGGADGTAGRDASQLSGYTDVMPTLLDLCGVAGDPPSGFDGTSLARILRGEDAEEWDARTFVTDTQRVAIPLKWRRSCAMRGSWRLVNREELYDLSADPGQTNNVSADHPAVVRELRDAYEAWWERCRDGIDEAVPVPIGTNASDEVVLRSHDLRSDQDHGAVWNQYDVRQAVFTVGWWEIDVQTAGTYTVELRRWPREAGHAINGGVGGEDIEYYRDGIEPGSEGWYSGSVAVDYRQATVIVDDSTRVEADIEPGAPAVMLTVPLEAGAHHLRALFSSPEGQYCAAYYVYIRSAIGVGSGAR